jgi:hypothetical protein
MTSLEIGDVGRSGPGVLEAGISGWQEQAGPGVLALSAHAALKACLTRNVGRMRAFCDLRRRHPPRLPCRA